MQRPRKGFLPASVGVGLPLLVGLFHVALVAPHYFVGSFDDDASYLLAAKALLGGEGLGGQLASGGVVAGAYPPGYPALLAPLVWISPHGYWVARLLSVAAYAGVFPLTWVYLRRRGLRPSVVSAILFVLALSPVLSTFGSMVMAESPFLVVFLVFLILVDRWDREERDLTVTSAGVLLAAASLVWLKEAAVGMVAGLVVWELVSRFRRARRSGFVRAGVLAAGTAVLLSPVVIARSAAGVPLLGSRYSVELGGYFAGGWFDRLFHVAPHGLWVMVSTAIPATVVPYLSPLPITGHAPDLWKALSWHVTVLVGLGAVVSVRRHRDAAVVIVPAYLLETLLWPFVNERRVILVIPVVVAWYVLGAGTVWSFIRRRLDERRPGLVGPSRTFAAVCAATVVVIPLTVQFPRDYLFDLGQSGSRFQGSRYMSVLSRLGTPADVVETDYLYSTALFSGHATARTAFDVALTACYLPGIVGAIDSDHAGYLLLGEVNKPGVMDSPCLLQVAGSQPWAVRILSTSRDHASVFELIGRGTGNPHLRDLTAGVVPDVSTSAGTTTSTWTWTWGTASPVSQVSVGEAGFRAGRTRSVTLELRTPGGEWMTAAHAGSPVGDGRGASPYLLVSPPAGTLATGLRVVVAGDGRDPQPVSTGEVSDVHALGPGGSG